MAARTHALASADAGRACAHAAAATVTLAAPLTLSAACRVEIYAQLAAAGLQPARFAYTGAVLAYIKRGVGSAAGIAQSLQARDQAERGRRLRQQQLGQR